MVMMNLLFMLMHNSCSKNNDCKKNHLYGDIKINKINQIYIIFKLKKMPNSIISILLGGGAAVYAINKGLYRYFFNLPKKPKTLKVFF
jgi:hypothetical protein